MESLVTYTLKKTLPAEEQTPCYSESLDHNRVFPFISPYEILCSHQQRYREKEKEGDIGWDP